MTNQTPDPVESAPTASHPSVDQLADLYEDLLGAAEAAALRTHLADCADCSDTLAALSGLTGLLAADQPPAMPQDVAARIDAALAAAVAEAAPSAARVTPSAPSAPARPAVTAPPGPARQHTGPGSPGPGRARPRRGRARLLAAVVACLAVLGGGTAAVLAGLDGTGSNSASSLGTAQGPAPSYAGSNAPAPQRGGNASPLTPAGPEFTAAGLPDQVRQLLPATSGNLPHASSEQAEPDRSSSSATVLPPCVESAVTGHQGEQPLLVTRGSFQSAPVNVYVFRISDDPAHLDVFLLTPGCATAAPNSPATVRLQEEIPAH